MSESAGFISGNDTAVGRAMNGLMIGTGGITDPLGTAETGGVEFGFVIATTGGGGGCTRGALERGLTNPPVPAGGRFVAAAGAGFVVLAGSGFGIVGGDGFGIAVGLVGDRVVVSRLGLAEIVVSGLDFSLGSTRNPDIHKTLTTNRSSAAAPETTVVTTVSELDKPRVDRHLRRVEIERGASVAANPVCVDGAPEGDNGCGSSEVGTVDWMVQTERGNGGGKSTAATSLGNVRDCTGRCEASAMRSCSS